MHLSKGKGTWNLEEFLKKFEPRLYTIYIRPLMIEVEGVFVAVASLWQGVVSEMFAMASILSCLLPYWVLVNDV